VKLISPFLLFGKQTDITAIHDFHEWRMRILDEILRGIFIVWMFALIGGIHNIFELYLQDVPLLESNLIIFASLITIYLASTALLIVITFNRKLQYELRAGLFLFILYALGIIGLIVAALSGDGRVFLFAFIVFSAVFFDYRYSLFALALGILTLVIVGWLQISAIIVVPVQNQINSTDAGAWVSGGLVLVGLSIAALTSITYLLQALTKSLREAHESLSREQKLSRMLHAISDINQLIVREQDQEKLLSKACERLIAGLGYGFVWIGLLASDGITFKLAASAGDDAIDPDQFSARLDGGDNSFFCAVSAIRSGEFFCVDMASAPDLCAACPRPIPEKRSAIALPLFRDERRFGALVIEHTQPMVLFDQEEIQLLQELADDLAYALENLEANKRLQTYARHQTLLNEITQNALETPDLETMLKKFIAGLEKALNADGYYIALWDEERCLPAQFISSDSLQNIFLSAPGKIASSDRIFSQSILDGGCALAIDDTMNTPYISPRVAALFPARSALGLPLIAKNHKLGALVIGFCEVHHFTPDEIQLGEQASSQIALAILKANLDNETHARATELGRLYAAALDMSSSMIDPPALLQKLAHHMTEALDATSGNIISVNMVESTMQVVAEYYSEAAVPAEKHSDLGMIVSITDYFTIMNSMIAGRALTLHSNTECMTEIEAAQFLKYGIHSMLFVPIISNGALLGCIEIWESRRRREFTLAEIRLAQAMAGHAAGILEKSNLFETLERREAYFRALIENSAEGIAILNAQGIIRYIASAEEDMTGFKTRELLGRSIFNRIHKDDLPSVLQTFTEGVATPGVIRTVQYRFQHSGGEWRYFEAVGHNMLDDPYVNGIVLNYRDITGRKVVEENLRRHAHELETLVMASSAFRTAPNVMTMIPILANQALRAVTGDYAAIFLLDNEHEDYVLSGWYSVNGASESLAPENANLRHRLGEGITGHVAMTGEIYVTEDIQNDVHARILEEEQERLKDLHGGISLPIRAQEQVIGVLHIRTINKRIFTETEIRLLIALVETAGNAIHRAMLFEQTLQHADEITHAYDNTLAGWARALEMRDEITEGHTRRVTELTLKLARAMDIPENEIVHIRRGALLHDIGKMGIPDSILHKPGPFTAQERFIMEQHTQYAYDMLSSISFLQDALDIPFCHHEHWDGNGYPRKLKGEQIPLSARIFTVVDVWDALTSDRPYRPAWTNEKTREYILERAGKQFDSRVVNAFFSLEFE